jgi:hypothetical protein
MTPEEWAKARDTEVDEDGTVTFHIPPNSVRRGTVRFFDTGATRDTDDGKYDYEGFLSPQVLERFAEYMHKHRVQADGSLRDSDNWQKGIPFDAYMKSAWRHFMDWWKLHRQNESVYTTAALADNPAVPDPDWDALEEALCAMMFNCQGYLHELLKARSQGVDSHEGTE